MADVNINLFKKIEENVTETEGFPDGYLIASIGGKVQGVNPDDIGGGGGGACCCAENVSCLVELPESEPCIPCGAEILVV